jgi:signal transduction histidine kinase
LRWYTKQFSRRVDIEAKLEVTEPERRLSSTVETSLFRIVQEALTNVTRHAEATLVQVLLQQDARTNHLEIKDNGCGFDVEAVLNHQTETQGAGLFGIRERVALLGGELHIYARPGEGTRLSIEIPRDKDHA